MKIEGALLKKSNQKIVGIYEALAHPIAAQKGLSEVSTRILEKIEKSLGAKPVALKVID